MRRKTQFESKCVVCGKTGDENAALFEDPYFSGVFRHLRCLNSPEGREWRKEQEKRDPGYRRYISLTTMGRKVLCSECNTKIYLWPKLRGHSPEYEACCDRCHRVNYNGLSPYGYPEREVVRQLSELSARFELGTHPQNLDEIMRSLAAEHDRLLRRQHCSCGGRFSLGAKPRCKKCRTVILDSFFHYSSGKPSAAGIQNE